MTRRCSHCCNNGHNSRTCPTRGSAGGGTSGGSGGGGLVGLSGGGVKLFGVRLTDGSFMKKSASMGNLMHYHSAAAAAASPNPGSPSSDQPQDPPVPVPVPDGYLSDDPNHASCSTNRRTERKKGVPWTAEEHRLFLLGLQKLGKGDWRGISRNFVVSRTPTQVASHAQKFFIRQSNASLRKRRSSLFDMVPILDTDPQPVPEEQILPTQPPQSQSLAPMTKNTNSLPSLELSLGTDAAEPKPMETTSSEQAEEEPSGEAQASKLPVDYEQPILFPAFIPYPFPYWPPNAAQQENNDVQATTSNHKVLKPTPMIPKEPVNVDELLGMSKLKLSEGETGHVGLPQLSLNLPGAPSRQSAFHASTAASFSSTDMSEGKSNINAV